MRFSPGLAARHFCWPTARPRAKSPPVALTPSDVDDTRRRDVHPISAEGRAPFGVAGVLPGGTVFDACPRHLAGRCFDAFFE